MTKTTKAPAKAAATKAPVEETTQKLGKAQLVDLMIENTGLGKKETGAVFDAVLEVIADAIKAGKTVGLPGLGTFSVKATAARTGVRPGTSEKIQIAAGKKVAYKVALDLKKSL